MASRGAPSSELAHYAYGGREYSPAGASKLATPIFLISHAYSRDPEEQLRRSELQFPSPVSPTSLRALDFPHSLT
jgi:hypothetical protein